MALFTPFDVTLNSNEDKSFSFWKEVLIDQSDFFKTKFSSGMSDSTDQFIKIDASDVIVEKLLTCMTVVFLKGSIKDMLTRTSIEVLIDLYKISDMYLCKYISHHVKGAIRDAPFSTTLLRFVREENPNFMINDLAERFIQLYNRSKDIDPSIGEDIDEELWMEIDEHAPTNGMCKILFTEGIMSDDIREKIVKNWMSISSSDLLDKIRESVAYHISRPECPKWIKMLHSKIIYTRSRPSVYKEVARNCSEILPL